MALPDRRGIGGWIRVGRPGKEITKEKAEEEEWESLAADEGEDWTLL